MATESGGMVTQRVGLQLRHSGDHGVVIADRNF